MLIVVGMHRSGTSATTGALRCVGVDLGERLYAGHADVNAKGYFEHSDIADTNDEALLAIGSGWDDVLARPADWADAPALLPHAKRLQAIIRRDFARSTLWAVKDPRVSRLLPWWLRLLDELGQQPHLLFVLRGPAAVARSLARRDAFSEEKAALLWLRHYLEAEAATRGLPRAFMAYDRFVDAPVAELARAESGLGLRFPTAPAQAREHIERFVSRDLQHHAAQAPSSPGPAMTLALRAEAALLHACGNATPTEPDVAALDAVAAELRALDAAWPAVLREHIGHIGRRRGDAELTLNKLTRSWSWYTGKPVRYVERLLGRRV